MTIKSVVVEWANEYIESLSGSRTTLLQPGVNDVPATHATSLNHPAPVLITPS